MVCINLKCLVSAGDSVAVNSASGYYGDLHHNSGICGKECSSLSRIKHIYRSVTGPCIGYVIVTTPIVFIHHGVSKS